MSTLTKEQILKYASAWQAFILLLPWYLNEFGIDTLNRLLGFIGLLVVFVILFLNRDNTEKVAVAVGVVDRFLKSREQTMKSKEVPERETGGTELFFELLKRVAEYNDESIDGEHAVDEEPIVTRVEGGTVG